VDNPTLNILSLCSGVGGLDLGLRLALGARARVVCYCEREAYCQAVLLARMEEAALDAAPIWTDLSSFDGRAWRGAVDLIAAGFPCQPYSIAGKRGGASDPRDLWPDVLRVVCDVAPALVFLENVAALARPGGGYFERVKPDLERAGYRVTQDIVAAAEAPASHLRHRLFVLAYSQRAEWRPLDKQPGQQPSQHEEDAGRVGAGSATLADASSARRADAESHGLQRAGWRGERRAASELRGAQMGDAECNGHEGLAARHSAAGALEVESGRDADGPSDALADTIGDRCGRNAHESFTELGRNDSSDIGLALPLIPPGPKDADGWARVLASVPAPQPSVCRLVTRPADRVERLRTIGNGVSPMAACMAFMALWAEVGVE
jgi:DNA (cytosine-5)-methyltransferase 1